MTRGWLIGGGLVAVVVVGGAIALLASGGDSASSSATTAIPGRIPGDLSDDQQAQLEEFRSCLEDQGVEPPEPDDGPPAIQRPDSDMLRALRECEQYMPEGAVPDESFGHP